MTMTAHQILLEWRDKTMSLSNVHDWFQLDNEFTLSLLTTCFQTLTWDGATSRSHSRTGKHIASKFFRSLLFYFLSLSFSFSKYFGEPANRLQFTFSTMQFTHKIQFWYENKKQNNCFERKWVGRRVKPLSGIFPFCKVLNIFFSLKIFTEK